MMFALLCFSLLVHRAAGASYAVQFTDVDYSCLKEPTSSAMKILSFNMWTNQLSVPGLLDLSFAFNVTKPLLNNVQIHTKVERKVGTTWVSIPCLLGIGACDNQTLCNLIQDACKTNHFIRPNSKEKKSSCSCQLETGVYTMEHARVYIKHKRSVKLTKLMGTGKYRFNIKFIESKPKATTAGCIMGYVTLLKPSKSL